MQEWKKIVQHESSERADATYNINMNPPKKPDFVNYARFTVLAKQKLLVHLKGFGLVFVHCGVRFNFNWIEIGGVEDVLDIEPTVPKIHCWPTP